MQIRNKIFLSTVVVALGASPVSADSRVQVVDENGQQIRSVHSINLAPGHIAVPARTLELFGLNVKYHAKDKRVYISMPRSAVQIKEGSATPPKGFKSGDHQIYNPIRGYLPERYSYPLALNQNGCFYVSVSVLCKIFPQHFTYRWDSSNRALVLQRQVSSVKVW